MKGTTTKTEITVEKQQRIMMRAIRPCAAWCEHCAEEVMMLTTDDAATFLETTARVIFQNVEAGELHFLETAGGGLLVCCNSIERRLKQ